MYDLDLYMSSSYAAGRGICHMSAMDESNLAQDENRLVQSFDRHVLIFTKVN